MEEEELYARFYLRVFLYCGELTKHIVHKKNVNIVELVDFAGQVKCSDF